MIFAGWYMEVVLSCFDVTLNIYLCQLVDQSGVMEFKFRYNGKAGNGQIFVMLHEVVKTGATFVLILVELLLDLSLLWRLELLLNHWRFFYQKESLFANWGDSGMSGSGIRLIPMALPFNVLSMTWFCVLLDCQWWFFSSRVVAVSEALLVGGCRG